MEYECPVCQCASIANHVGDRDLLDIECLRCGKYRITGTAETMLSRREISEDERLLLSMWIYENQGVEFSSDHIRRFPKVSKPSVHDRGLRLIREFARRNTSLGEEVKLDFVSEHIRSSSTRISREKYAQLAYEDQEKVKAIFELMSLSWCRNTTELIFLINDYLTNELGWLKDWMTTGVTISPEGWIHLEEQEYESADSPIAFIAMWFDPQTDRLWAEGIEPAITGAGYRPLKINQEIFLGRIEDKIMASIRGSKFVVADFTDQRDAVIYECGFAQGLGIPVIHTCRKDDFEKTNFDVSHYPFLIWENDKIEQFRKELKEKILALWGEGPYIVQDDEADG